MNTRTAAQLAGGILLVALGVTLAVRCTSHPSTERDALLTDAQMMELQIVQLLTRARERASELERSGNHLEAAALWVDIAGADKLLLKHSIERGQPLSPTLTELTAVTAFRLAKKEKAYLDFLRAMYPAWQSDAGDRNGGRSE